MAETGKTPVILRLLVVTSASLQEAEVEQVRPAEDKARVARVVVRMLLQATAPFMVMMVTTTRAAVAAEWRLRLMMVEQVRIMVMAGTEDRES